MVTVVNWQTGYKVTSKDLDAAWRMIKSTWPESLQIDWVVLKDTKPINWKEYQHG